MHSLTGLAKVSALIVVKIKTRTPFRGEGRDRVIQKASRLLVYYQETKKEKSLAIIRQNTTAAILVLHGVTWRKSVLVCWRCVACICFLLSLLYKCECFYSAFSPLHWLALILLMCSVTRLLFCFTCSFLWLFWTNNTFHCFAAASVN